MTRSLPLSTTLIISLVLIASCGGESKSKNGASSKGVENSGDVGKNSDGRDTKGDGAGTDDVTVTPSGSGTTKLQSVESDSDLGKCSTAKQGQIVYVVGSGEFFVCSDGEWESIDLKGEKGDKGDSSDSLTKSLQLYKKYRASIVRIQVRCEAVDPATCADVPGFSGSGTGFLCSAKTICTNRHVVECSIPGSSCQYRLGNMTINALKGTNDSLMDGDGNDASFEVVNSATPEMTLHVEKDLAAITLANAPTGVKPIPLSTKRHNQSVKTLDPILSLSFPLGFTDLYTDIGNVNTPNIADCRDNSKYGCIGGAYDFSTTNDTDKGSSGSPLINITTGQVVGITSAGTDQENANYTWAIDASFLNDIKE